MQNIDRIFDFIHTAVYWIVIGCSFLVATGSFIVFSYVSFKETYKEKRNVISILQALAYVPIFAYLAFVLFGAGCTLIEPIEYIIDNIYCIVSLFFMIFLGLLHLIGF